MTLITLRTEVPAEEVSFSCDAGVGVAANGSMPSLFPLMMSIRWIAVHAKGMRYLPSLSQFNTAAVRILSLCWIWKKYGKMEDYQRKMQKACNSCQAPHSLTQQLIAFFLYAWFEKKKKMENVEREQNYFLLEIHLINWPQMQESTHEQVWSDLKQSKFLLTQRNLAISNPTLKAHNSLISLLIISYAIFTLYNSNHIFQYQTREDENGNGNLAGDTLRGDSSYSQFPEWEINWTPRP